MYNNFVVLKQIVSVIAMKSVTSRHLLYIYGVYMSQLIRYSRTCNSYQDFLQRSVMLTRKLLSQGFIESRPPACCHLFVVGDCVPQWPGWLCWLEFYTPVRATQAI